MQIASFRFASFGHRPSCGRNDKLKAQATHETHLTGIIRLKIHNFPSSRCSMLKKPISAVILIILLSSLALAACGPKATVTPAVPTAIRVALLPVLDVLPMVVAQQEGPVRQIQPGG